MTRFHYMNAYVTTEHNHNALTSYNTLVVCVDRDEYNLLVAYGYSVSTKRQIRRFVYEYYQELYFDFCHAVRCVRCDKYVNNALISIPLSPCSRVKYRVTYGMPRCDTRDLLVY